MSQLASLSDETFNVIWGTLLGIESEYQRSIGNTTDGSHWQEPVTAATDTTTEQSPEKPVGLQSTDRNEEPLSDIFTFD